MRRLALTGARVRCASTKLLTNPSALSKSSATPSVQSNTAMHCSADSDNYCQSLAETLAESAVVILEKPCVLFSDSETTDPSDLTRAASPSPSIPMWITPSRRNAKRQVAAQSRGSSGATSLSQLAWMLLNSELRSISPSGQQVRTASSTARQAASLPKLEKEELS